MQKSLSIFSSKKIPFAFILCLFLLILTEFVSRQLSVYYMPTQNLLYLHRRSFLSQENPLKYEGVIIGDSRVMAVNAQKISAAISKKIGREFNVYNFSVFYSDIRHFYLILKNYLEKHESPEIVFLSLMPESVFGGWNVTGDIMNSREGYISRLCLLSSVHDLWLTYPKLFFLKKLLIPKIENMSYFLTYRLYLRHFNSAQLKENHLQRIEDGMRKTSGGIYFAQDIPLTEETLKGMAFYNQDVNINVDSAKWYKKIIQLAERKEIPVIIFNAPYPDTVYNMREKNGFNRRYNRFIEEISKEFKNVYFVLPIIDKYKDDLSADWIHLNLKGVEIFNKQLTQKLGDIVRKIDNL